MEKSRFTRVKGIENNKNARNTLPPEISKHVYEGFEPLKQQSEKRNRKKNSEEYNRAKKLLGKLDEINGIDFSSKFNTDSKKFQREIENFDRRIIKLEKELTKVNSSSKLNPKSFFCLTFSKSFNLRSKANAIRLGKDFKNHM